MPWKIAYHFILNILISNIWEIHVCKTRFLQYLIWQHRTCNQKKKTNELERERAKMRYQKRNATILTNQAPFGVISKHSTMQNLQENTCWYHLVDISIDDSSSFCTKKFCHVTCSPHSYISFRQWSWAYRQLNDKFLQWMTRYFSSFSQKLYNDFFYNN